MLHQIKKVKSGAKTLSPGDYDLAESRSIELSISRFNLC
jgi:hypothetical protein